jgi:DNA primase
VFESLRARLDRIFAEQGARPDARAYAAGLRDAVVDARAAVSEMRDGVARSERELAAERRQLEDAERRGRLAAEIPDPETVAVAERFAAKHRERVGVLERKLAVQRDEVAMAEREVAKMTAQLREAQQGRIPTAPARSAPDPALERESDLMEARAERARHEAAVEAQLAHLKKKLGKDQ